MKLRLPTQQPKRSLLQQKALIAAITNSSNPTGSNIYCPYCGAELILGHIANYETLDEHVSCVQPSPKQGYTCTCDIGKYHEWIIDGSSYSSLLMRNLYNENKDEFDRLWEVGKEHKFQSALNTFNANAEISIYKTGLKKENRLWPWLTFNKVQLYIEHHYEANDFGQVTKHWITLGFLKKDRNEFCIVGSWHITTWKFLYRQFKHKLDKLQKHEKNFCLDLETEGADVEQQTRKWTKRRDALVECLFEKSMNRSWKYRAFDWALKYLYWNRYHMYKHILKQKENG